MGEQHGRGALALGTCSPAGLMLAEARTLSTATVRMVETEDGGTEAGGTEAGSVHKELTLGA